MPIDLWTSNNESTWRRKIGMSKKDDARPPRERNVYLRRLKGLVEQRMLEFIYEKPDAQTRAERAPTWTPIPWICHNLEISHSCLSRLFRELLGMNVIQFHDKLKLEETLTVLNYIALIREFAATCDITPYTGNGSANFWTWLKAKRSNPDFDRQLLAREFNFPSAARFHRAFYFATNQTPREFENLIIRQAIDDPTELEKTIASFTPTQEALRLRGMYPLRDVHEILPDYVTLEPEHIAELERQNQHPPVDLEYPIVLYKPTQPETSKVIEALYKVVNRHEKRIPKRLPVTLAPELRDEGVAHPAPPGG